MQTSKTFTINEDSWQAYRQQLYFFILKRVQDHFIAEDITQDVLLRVYSRLDSLSSREKFLPWFYQIARNAIADYYRRSRTEPELFEELASLDAMDVQSTYAELAPCLPTLILRLPSHYQSAILSSEIENLSQRELAEKTGLSLAGAKSRVQRGRKMLKELLLQSCKIQLNEAGKPFDVQSGCAPRTPAKAE